jgi:hypothetical protein
LEHLYHPLEVLKEARRAGRYIAIKFPAGELCSKKLAAVVGGKKICGSEHKSGHLWAWRQMDVFSLQNGARLNLLNHRLVELPEEIRYYDPNEISSKLPFLPNFLVFLEKTSFKISRSVYRFLFGSTLVGLAKAG